MLGGRRDAGYARRLSGGQQQRVAIAQALANDPPLVTVDERTGDLDSTTAHAVFGVLESLPARGKTVIYGTHDRPTEPTTACADRAGAPVDLLDGRIVATRALS
jgi:ABC-type lipoprotein export system ATPase subunit